MLYNKTIKREHRAEEIRAANQGTVEYASEDITIIHFCAPVTGQAHLTQSGGGDTPSGESYLKVLVMDRYGYEELLDKDPNTIYLLRG